MHFRPRRTGQLLLVALTLSTFHFPLSTFGQRPPAQPSASEILHRMQKLNVLGSVLYIVAHPDDENTRLIAWLANGKKVRTGNLSLTRGDGGQNLIGPELGDALGIIRTQELMEARRIDGGEQFFTRAVDFGYSKNAAESFEKWGKQEVLSDVVRVIRQFRPDIIITRFPPTREAGHGHHEASAILAAEAFDLAGDPKAFPEQLEQDLEVWQPRRLFFNGSTWWKKDLAEFAKNDPDWFTVDVGGYDPLLGLSYTEIAGRSRSMHKSQGFGAAETRGEMIEYLHFEKGDKPKTKDIFEGIDMTWGRMKGAKPVNQLVRKLIQDYSVERPSNSIDRLRKINAAVESWPDSPWKELIISRTDELSLQCAGLVIEALAPVHTYPISSLQETLKCQIIVRGEHPVTVGIYEGREDIPLKEVSPPRNQPSETSQQLRILPYIDQPYWLSQRHDLIHQVGYKDIGKPVVGNLLQPCYFIKLGGGEIIDAQPALYKWVDRVAGERIRPVHVTPCASVMPKTDVLIARGGPQTIDVEVEALSDSLKGELRVVLPEGWATTDDYKLVNIAKRNDRQSHTFKLSPLEDAKSGVVRFEIIGPESGPFGRMNRTFHEIDYPHIMPQVYYTPAEVKLVPLNVKTTAKTVGYIKGAGDDVPQAIEQLGATVDMIEPSTATLESISKYDAIVVGIRAYNNNHALKQFNPTLMKYVENGGTVVVQYTTRTSDMVLPDTLIGPYPFKLTRDRVTVEEAPPTFLAKDHPLLNTPNTITSADFDGWVQERGLYFVGGFEKHYTPLIAWNDPGEQPLNGGLITCDYGKGRYVYTGISFFRQLPAGVPGAYRLFANLISKRITP